MDDRKSIFELENRIIDPSFEMNRLYSNFFSRERLITKEYSEYIFVEELNEKIFPTWPYRDTFITVDEYLKFLGVTGRTFDNEAFLYFWNSSVIYLATLSIKWGIDYAILYLRHVL